MSKRLAVLLLSLAAGARAGCITASRSDLQFCSGLVPSGATTVTAATYFGTAAGIAAQGASDAAAFVAPMSPGATSTGCQATVAVFFCQKAAGPSAGQPAAGA